MIATLEYPALNQLATSDPTRTRTLRRRFMQQMTRRWAEIKRDIRVSIVDRDCFGWQDDVLVTFAATRPKQFAFGTDAQKLEGFMAWLEEQEAQGVLQLIRRPGAFMGTVEQPWTNVYIDSGYQQGIRDGRAKLRRAGVPVPPDEIMGGVTGIFNQPIHAESVAAIYGRTFRDLKSVTDVANTQIARLIDEGLRQGLALGLAEGKNPRAIARELVKDVANRVDKIGIVRSRMIARSEVIRAHHVAAMNEYDEAQAVLGPEKQIVADWLLGRGPCPSGICPDMETGGPYTVERARGLIPAHPNCFPGGVMVSGPRPTGSTARWFDGQVVDLVSRLGRKVTVTPNHPVLTLCGWVAAADLHEGCDLLCGLEQQGIVSAFYPKDYQVPAKIEDVAATLGSSREMVTSAVPVAAMDFHGDGLDGDVCIVRADGLFQRAIETEISEPISELPSIFASTLDGFLSGHSFSPEFKSGSLTASAGDVRRASYQMALGSRVPGRSEGRGFMNISTLEPKQEKPSLDGGSRYAIPSRESLLGFATSIETDQLVSIRYRQWAGHVYNLQTLPGWYMAEGIVVKNCTCATTPRVVTAGTLTDRKGRRPPRRRERARARRTRVAA